MALKSYFLTSTNCVRSVLVPFESLDLTVIDVQASPLFKLKMKRFANISSKVPFLQCYYGKSTAAT